MELPILIENQHLYTCTKTTVTNIGGIEYDIIPFPILTQLTAKSKRDKYENGDPCKQNLKFHRPISTIFKVFQEVDEIHPAAAVAFFSQ
jgi:hypothetical protein